MHPHNTRQCNYKSLEEVPQDVIEAFDAGRMLIPSSAFSGPTFAWGKLEWVNVSRMPEPPSATIECLGFTWHLTGEMDERGQPLYRVDLNSRASKEGA